MDKKKNGVTLADWIYIDAKSSLNAAKSSQPHMLFFISKVRGIFHHCMVLRLKSGLLCVFEYLLCNFHVKRRFLF